MVVNEEVIQENPLVVIKNKFAQSVSTRFIKFISSVKFGVTQIILVALLSLIGMLIMQQNVEGFDHYYAALKPAQKLVYGRLGLFDIYHTWYFNALLIVLAINIVLASIERAPKTWKIVRNRKLTASRRWLLAQKTSQRVEFQAPNLIAATEKARRAMRVAGVKAKITETSDAICLFGERGAWNRLGYLMIHVGFLMILTGGFLTTQFGSDGQMPLAPGDTSARMLQTEFVLDRTKQKPVSLPFEVTCLDIEQKLIDPNGGIVAANTLDWLTRIRISDATGEHEALVHMNNPVDYGGYRFFQASFISEGKARSATLQITPADNSSPPQEVKISRDGTIKLPNGVEAKWEEFAADFAVGANGQIESQSEDYNNPALILLLKNANGETRRAYAFAGLLPPNAPINQPVMGYRFQLKNFEKVAAAHVLSVNKDPGKTPFYLGGVILITALLGVFFFSHRRIWALVEEKGAGNFELILGGNTNRHTIAFEEDMRKIVAAVGKN
ncbi:MAG: cytochrome c biogenesis protein ResB [Pyrinomonadaceae bacterium]